MRIGTTHSFKYTLIHNFLQFLHEVPVVTSCWQCFSDELVRKLGAIPVDYRAKDVRDRLIAEGPFEVILDCVNNDLTRWSDKVRKRIPSEKSSRSCCFQLMSVWKNSVHVSVVSPLMRDTDRYGLLTGLATTAVKHICRSYEVVVSSFYSIIPSRLHRGASVVSEWGLFSM